jgi:hypothetical protein
MESTQKKQYSAPKLTDHGSVVEKTRGIMGWSYEPWGQMIYEDDTPVKPPPRGE